MTNSIATALALTLSAATCLAQESNASRGYFTVSGEGAIGYYALWETPEDIAGIRDDLGIHFVGQTNPFATAMRFTVARTTKRGRLTWGLSYYRSSSSRRIDSTYTAPDGGYRIAKLDGHEISDIGNAWTVFFEPRIMRRGRFSLHGHAAIGNTWYESDAITFPVDGGPIEIATRRADNAGWMHGHAAYGLAARYRANPFYSVYAAARHNWLVDTGTSELVELALGIELNLRRGGVSVEP